MTVRYHSTAEQLRDDAAKVRPHPENPRNGDTDAIIASIRQVGCYRPVYAWAQTGEILAGNHTYHALLELGETRIPIAWVEADSREEALQILFNDNRAADLGRYDEAQTLMLLEELERQNALPATYMPSDLEDLRHLLDDASWDPNRAGNDDGAGDPDDDSMLPHIDLRVPADVFDGWRALLDTQEGDTDATRLRAYLNAHGFLLTDAVA